MKYLSINNTQSQWAVVHGLVISQHDCLQISYTYLQTRLTTVYVRLDVL